MGHCFKALECLGYALFNDETLQHRALLERLMPGASPKLIAATDAYTEQLRGLLHMGRHAKGESIKLSKADSELAVLATNALLLYFAKSRKP